MPASGLLHPVGPEPTRVYWTRRIALLVLLVVVVAALAYGCSGSGGGSPADTAGHGGSGAGPTPSVTTSATAQAAPVRCDDTTLSVSVASDATTYAAGVLPHFTAVVRNVGTAPCRLLAQPGARQWRVLSGTDAVWASDDCTPGGHRVVHRLRPRHQVTYAQVWDRHRSTPGCASPGEAAAPGTYRLYVQVDGVDADAPVVFHLTQ